MKWLGRLCGCSNNLISETPVTSGNTDTNRSPGAEENEKSTSVLQYLTIPSKYTSSNTDTNTECDETDELENEIGPILSYSRSIGGDSQPSLANSTTNPSAMAKNETIAMIPSLSAMVRNESTPSKSCGSSEKDSFIFGSDYACPMSCEDNNPSQVQKNETLFQTTSQKNKRSLKLLFLDIDGVLCFSGHMISSVHLHRILKIIKKTQCKVVLSTTWRLQSDLKRRIFEAFAHGLAELDNNTQMKKSQENSINVHEHIIGQTPDFKHLCPRAFEIMAFVDAVKTFPDVHLQDWVAIDDTNLYAACGHSNLKQQIKDHFVRCNATTGITEEIMENIISKLNGHHNTCCTHQEKENHEHRQNL